MRHIKWVSFQDVIDERGRLTAIEGNHHTPFAIERVFYVHQVTPGIDRGGHAHRDTDQVITVVHGSLKVGVSNGKSVRSFVLDHPGRGLYVPRMIWVRLYDFSAGGVCLVLASTKYDRSKSIRTWENFLEARGAPRTEDPFGE